MTDNYSNVRFMVVDDKPFNRKMVRTMLLRLRVTYILEAENGREALEILHKNGGKVDCIISDWNMEPVSGLELLRTIRAGNTRFTSPATPFIMLTVHAEAEKVHSALAMDPHGYVIKPVSFRNLVKAIDSALARKIALQSAEHYHDAKGGEEWDPENEHIVPAVSWVMWMTKLAKRNQFQECLQNIRQEALGLNQGRQSKLSRPQNKRESAVSRIPVGTILAENIYDPACMLLVEGGTQMTPGLLGRLHRLVVESGEEFKLWIGDG